MKRGRPSGLRELARIARDARGRFQRIESIHTLPVSASVASLGEGAGVHNAARQFHQEVRIERHYHVGQVEPVRCIHRLSERQARALHAVVAAGSVVLVPLRGGETLLKAVAEVE